MLRLAYLSPAILERLLVERVAPTVSVKDLAAVAELPWAEQEVAVFGLEWGACKIAGLPSRTIDR